MQREFNKNVKNPEEKISAIMKKTKKVVKYY